MKLPTDLLDQTSGTFRLQKHVVLLVPANSDALRTPWQPFIQIQHDPVPNGTWPGQAKLNLQAVKTPCQYQRKIAFQSRMGFSDSFLQRQKGAYTPYHEKIAKRRSHLQ